MIQKIVSVETLVDRDKWSADYFTAAYSFQGSSVFEFLPLSQLAAERKQSLDRQKFPNHLFNYLGLEFIESFTGRLVGFKPKEGKEVKSRSKVFREGDVLFGRLRPELTRSI